MRLSLRTKLLTGFFLVALVGSLVGLAGILGTGAVVSSDQMLYRRIAVPLSALVPMTESFQKIRINLRDLVAAKSEAERKTYLGNIAPLQATREAASEDYAKTITSEQGRKLFEAYRTADESYRRDLASIEKLLGAGNLEGAAQLVHGQAMKEAQVVQEAIDAMVAYKGGLGNQISVANRDLGETVSWAIGVLMVLGWVLSAGLGIGIGVFMVSRPLMRISGTLGAGADQISSASGQLTAASQDIANGATEQASSIEETSSSMEELSSMVKQNVSNAKEASILADRAAESSTAGYSQMEKMLAAMNDISQSGDKIRKIIKVIDDIAFKTNILALNAAVEAARAGEAGMGFAVVADEVKNLANRSADAAKETADMIEDSLKKTSGGLEIATKLAEVFKDILLTAKKVSEMAREVETASTQQDTGIDQVNKAIVQFDEVVQTNASSAEETASAAEELQSQVGSLNDMVAQLTKLVTGQRVR